MKLNIVEELSKLNIKTTQKGTKTFCCCPFHKEDSPSCLIDAKNNRYHCFGCGEDGDVYDLVSKLTGTPKDILKGKTIYLSNEIKANNLALKFYQTGLLNTKIGDTILASQAKRGLTKEVVEYFNIGYAQEKDSLYNVFEGAKKIGELSPISSKHPLIKENKTDFFKSRIMFPIFDLNNNVLGFTGRTTVNDDIKYLNTPETLEFKKKEVLYNFTKALTSIKATKKVYIVEGPYDVIAYYLCGILNVVSPLTCNLSKEQLNLLTKNCGKDLEFVVAFDSDKAGINGIKNCMELFKSESIWNYKIIKYAYKDAGEYIEKGEKDKLKALISKPLDIASYMASFYNKTKNQDTKSRIINSFVSLIYTFPDIFLKEEVVKFETLINDKESFTSDILFKRKGDNNLLKLIMFQIKEEPKKMEIFNLLVNEKLLTKSELSVIHNLPKYSFNNFKNSYKITNLVVAFIKKRAKKIIEG